MQLPREIPFLSLMAAPNKLLAKSLTLLADLQKVGKHVVRGTEFPRMDRQRLQKAGFIEEVVRGWYLPSRPDAQPGSSAAWFAGVNGSVKPRKYGFQSAVLS